MNGFRGAGPGRWIQSAKRVGPCGWIQRSVGAGPGKWIQSAKRLGLGGWIQMAEGTGSID